MQVYHQAHKRVWIYVTFLMCVALLVTASGVVIDRANAISTSGLYGDGSDGVGLLGNDVISGRNYYYTNLSIAPSSSASVRNVKVFVQDTLLINGSSLNADGVDGGDGGDGTNVAGGTAPAGGSVSSAGQHVTGLQYLNGFKGGNGGAPNVAGANCASGFITTRIRLGGDANAGRDGCSSATRSGGNACNEYPTTLSKLREILTTPYYVGTVLFGSASAGAGGGGGGTVGAGGGAGGSSGSSAGGLMVYAKKIVCINGGNLTAIGGHGGNGGDGYGGFGGGGGCASGAGGGIVSLVYDEFIDDGTCVISVDGGEPGVQGTGGTSCVFTECLQGDDGTIILYNALTGEYE